ncbi:MAG: Xaa-Pro peptidase family protein [Thermodesulfobacteriota bacterium]
MDLNRARALMAQAGIDLLVASCPENIFYASGFPVIPSVGNRGVFNQARISQSVFALLPQQGDPALVCSAGVAGVVRQYSRFKDIRFCSTNIYIERPKGRVEVLAPTAVECLSQLIVEKAGNSPVLGLEHAWLSASAIDNLRRLLPQARFKEAANLFWELRKIKSAEEIEKVRAAVRTAEQALVKAISVIREGITEREVLQVYKQELLGQGCDWGTTSMGAGVNSGEVYHVAGDYRLRVGDVVRFDLGAIHQGYFCDISRTACVGKLPDELKPIFSVCLEAQTRMVEMIRPGVKFKELFNTGVETVRKGGYANYHRADMGHSFGLIVREPPFIEADSEQELQPGMVIAVEAPFYISGVGGVNIENNVLITSDGREVLDHISKELYVC